MKVFTKAIEAIYSEGEDDGTAGELAKPKHTKPYMTNAIFTMASLASKIEWHNGKYLLMYDEMSLLFKNIDNNSKESPMRQVFLSMAQGDAMTRVTNTAGEEILESTHVNFCGKLS